jgi:hypothetical protein
VLLLKRIDCQLVLLPTKICVLKLLRNVCYQRSRTNYVSTGNYCPCNRSVLRSSCLWCSIILGICDFRWCANTEIIGIISEHDVLPLRLITLECVKQTKRANTAVELIRENLNAVDSECVVWKYLLYIIEL